MDTVNKEDANTINLELPAPLLWDIHNALTFSLIYHNLFRKESGISEEELMVVQRLRDGIGDILEKENPKNSLVEKDTTFIN